MELKASFRKSAVLAGTLPNLKHGGFVHHACPFLIMVNCSLPDQLANIAKRRSCWNFLFNRSFTRRIYGRMNQPKTPKICSSCKSMSSVSPPLKKWTNCEKVAAHFLRGALPAEVIAAAAIYNPPTGTIPIIDDNTKDMQHSGRAKGWFQVMKLQGIITDSMTKPATLSWSMRKNVPGVGLPFIGHLL